MYVYPPPLDTRKSYLMCVTKICTLSIFGFQIFMFIIFYTSFGDKFLAPATVLIYVEVLALIAHAVDWSWAFEYFKSNRLVDDIAHQDEIDRHCKSVK